MALGNMCLKRTFYKRTTVVPSKFGCTFTGFGWVLESCFWIALSRSVLYAWQFRDWTYCKRSKQRPNVPTNIRHVELYCFQYSCLLRCRQSETDGRSLKQTQKRTYVFRITICDTELHGAAVDGNAGISIFLSIIAGPLHTAKCDAPDNADNVQQSLL